MLAAVSSIVGTASLERCACSRALQMAAVVLGMEGGLGEEESVWMAMRVKQGVKRTSQKWGGGAEKNITFRGMKTMLCLH